MVFRVLAYRCLDHDENLRSFCDGDVSQMLLPVMQLQSLASQLDARLGYYKVFYYISAVLFSQFFPP